MTPFSFGIVLFGLALIGCDVVPPASQSHDQRAEKERWDYANDPERFGLSLKRSIDVLPLQGEAQVIPWTETYWPSMDDSMNARWQGPETLSPLEKYDFAFNGWRPSERFYELRPLTRENCSSGQWDPEYYEQLGPAARRWSDWKGNGRARNGIDDDGDGLVDECDDLDGIEEWWGSCHAWVPASILELEPLEPVVYNGVRFEVSDIKALLILLYDDSRQIAVGERCGEDVPERDARGRVIDAACRNTNAGTFHVMVTNLIGLMGQPLGEDRVAGRQVWNQPISGYRVESLTELSLSQTLSLLNLPTHGAYVYHPDAVRFLEVKMALDYITESHPSAEPLESVIRDYIRTDRYHYVLELDASGEIVGGEWVPNRGDENAQTDRPDYLWLAIGPGKTPIPEVDALAVRQLHRASRPDTRTDNVETYRTTVDERIPDWPLAGIQSVISVPDDVVPSRVVVGYTVLHDFIYDLSVRLVRNGQEIVLFDRKPKGSYTTIVDRHEIPELVGVNAQGEWTLVATDHQGRSVGRFVEWHIELFQD